MEGLISTFHLDIKLIIAQLVNFSIVLFVLFKFAYKPLLSAMNERTAKIEKGLEDAQKAQEELSNAEKTREEKLVEAKKEAKLILEEAQMKAEQNKNDMVAKARQEAEKVVAEAKKQISSEKDKMLREVKQEIGNLVALAAGKVVQERIDEKADGALIADAIQKIK